MKKCECFNLCKITTGAHWKKPKNKNKLQKNNYWGCGKISNDVFMLLLNEYLVATVWAKKFHWNSIKIL